MALPGAGVSASKPEQNAILQITPEGFLRRTQPKMVPVENIKPYVDGGQVNFQLPRAGLGYQLWVLVQGTVTVSGTVSAGTFSTYPNPVPNSFFKRIRFGSNNATYMRDVSGHGAYKLNRYRYINEPFSQNSSSRFSTNSMNVLGVTGSNRAFNTGTIVSGTTYTFNQMVPIPLSYNWSAETGLVVLQNQSIFTLSLDCATISSGISSTGGSNDFFDGLSGTGISVAVSATVECYLEFFEALDPSQFDYREQLSMFVSQTEQTFPLINGNNVFQPPQNDWYTMMLLELVNNKAPVPDANMSNIRLSHSGAVDVYQQSRTMNMIRSYYMHEGLPPMDGVIDFDLGLRRGMPARRDTIDAFNDMHITDLRLGVTTSGLTLSNAQATLTMEALRRVG